jgi:TolB-like protein/DNA-binding winged helix-turn-helix (wHTH) protein
VSVGYRLGEWTVRPHRNRIERADVFVHLEPKAMAVLDCLVQASNSVVTRQEIFDSVWPGAAVSDDVLTQRIAELRKALGDSAQRSKIIETIPKVGFRLIPPVNPLVDDPSSDRGIRRTREPIQASKWIALAMVGLLIAVLSLSHFWPDGPEVRSAPTVWERPVIAVLPFVNLSEDPNNEYFSDGISEELINLLANVPGLHVISRSSSFSFKDERLKIAELARELKASLIVEGTVRKIDNRVRITAQLIDPAADIHLLSESYDREISDIFSLQQEIAQSIVSAMQEKIGIYTVTVERPTKNIEAYELFLLGRHSFYQRGAAIDGAIRAFQMAVEEDPEFAEAWVFLAAAASVTWGYQTAISNEEARLIAERASSKALELNPGSGLALAVQGMLAWHYDGNLKNAFPLMDRALQEDPDHSTVRFWAGMFYFGWGYLEEAIHHFNYSFEHDPRVGITNGMLGLAYLAQGREDLAGPRLAKATELGWTHHFQVQASQHMMRGETDAAFAFLKFTFADSGTDSGPLPWIYELEEAGRSFIENRESTDTLVSVIERVPARVAFADEYLTLLFNLKDPFFEYFSRTVDESHLWPTFLTPILWLPEYRSYVEDPRFLDIVGRNGALEIWEQRGFPDGCSRVDDPIGERLDCSQRYQ